MHTLRDRQELRRGYRVQLDLITHTYEIRVLTGKSTSDGRLSTIYIKYCALAPSAGSKLKIWDTRSDDLFFSVEARRHAKTRVAIEGWQGAYARPSLSWRTTLPQTRILGTLQPYEWRPRPYGRIEQNRPLNGKEWQTLKYCAVCSRRLRTQHITGKLTTEITAKQAYTDRHFTEPSAHASIGVL